MRRRLPQSHFVAMAFLQLRKHYMINTISPRFRFVRSPGLISQHSFYLIQIQHLLCGCQCVSPLPPSYLAHPSQTNRA
jgi:hypothetical protein